MERPEGHSSARGQSWKRQRRRGEARFGETTLIAECSCLANIKEKRAKRTSVSAVERLELAALGQRLTVLLAGDRRREGGFEGRLGDHGSRAGERSGREEGQEGAQAREHPRGKEGLRRWSGQGGRGGPPMEKWRRLSPNRRKL